MKRRAFIAGLSAAAAWPLAVWAQQSGTPVRCRPISRRTAQGRAAGLIAARLSASPFGT
jgi:hypothetical protein